MPSTYSPLLRFEEIGSGEQSGLWGDTTNKNLGELVEQAIAGVTTVSLSGTSDVTLSALDGALDQSRSAVLKFIGAPSGPINIIIPTSQKLYVVRNESGQTITVKTVAQVGGVVLLDDEATLVFCDGTNAIVGIQTEGVGTLGVPDGGTGAETFTAGFIKSPGGTGNLFGAATVNLTAEVSGQLPTANGGTGVSATNYCNLTTNVNGILPVVSGGTGASNIATARANLGLGTVSIIDTTGSTTTFLRGDGQFATPPTSGGTVTSVSGGTGITITGTAVAPIVNLSSVLAPGNYTNASISVNGSGVITSVSTGSSGGTGTVTQVNTFGSVSGLTLTGGPITSSGTITLGGSLSGSAPSLSVGSASTATTASSASGLTGSPFISVSGVSSSGNVSAFSGASYAALQSQSIALFNTSTGMSCNGSTFAWQFSGGLVMQVNSSGVAPNSSGVWGSFSDSRIKENIVPARNYLNDLCQLEVVNYNLKEKPQKMLGFVAQQVEAVMPGLIDTAENEYYDLPDLKSIKTSVLIPMLVQAVQDLKAGLDAANAEIAALKG